MENHLHKKHFSITLRDTANNGANKSDLKLHCATVKCRKLRLPRVFFRVSLYVQKRETSQLVLNIFHDGKFIAFVKRLNANDSVFERARKRMKIVRSKIKLRSLVK